MSDAIRIAPATRADADAMRALVVAAYGHFVERMGKEPGPCAPMPPSSPPRAT
ncbi:hypothetical protein [Agrococcus jejuensis]|uniref:hypothetical protein n=1 Tax=Agrococcus jejuensis TaxID=399736 RepID=UPI0012F944DF|nr:hypothetical protein [Agrococcus jejuensis]